MSNSDWDETRERIRRRNLVGCLNVEERSGLWEDSVGNLGVVLASYFERHVDRPVNDPTDDETGFGVWALEKAYAALEMIAAEVCKKGWSDE